MPALAGLEHLHRVTTRTRIWNELLVLANVWDAASAATVLIIGRVLSIVAKIIGGASADRIGAKASARRMRRCAGGIDLR